MPLGEPEIAYCHACGTTMDVSQVAPFSNVECPACGKHTRVKREFGPYTLLRRHAIGGMSVVFIAHDNTLDREVVVKILNEEYGANEHRITAFEEEARITASFSHPHVVRVFTTGRAFGRFYIAMELVGGGHFEHHIRERGSIPEGEMLPLSIQIAEGLKAAQAAGLIHRDVKPGNILLDVSGNAKIVDFGLALVTKGGKAKAAEIWATPYYVPPETIEGMQEDFRSDIYAFGATIYHALAGKPPCDEESMDTNKLREAKRRILPLAKMAPWVSLDTCLAVDRAMAHDPNQRFRSYNDLLSALETARQRLAAGIPVTPASVARHAANRRREKMSLIVAGIMVLVALAFGIWWVGRSQEEEYVVSEPSRISSTTRPPGKDGSDGQRAGTAYREAGEALRAGDYSKAGLMFAAVRDDPGVLEPTGSWAACQAVVCAYLNGSSNEARQEAGEAMKHLSNAIGVDNQVSDDLLMALDKVKDLRPVIRPESAPAPTGPALVAALLHGLKNWEQGMPEAARPHFEAIAAVEAKGADTWIEPYRSIVAGYLADLETLKEVVSAQLPGDPATCRSLADELHAVHSGLKTKGRARFNIRALQLELEKHARLLESAVPAAPVAPADTQPQADSADPLAAVHTAAAECRFADAAALLKEANGADARVVATLLLAEAAEAFLGELEDNLKSPQSALPLELRDSTKVDNITGTRPGGLRTLDADGKLRDISWSELSPDSMIALHRALVKGTSSELDRLRRHEQAIAFDLLAGNADRAKDAGNKLALSSPAFKRRWDAMQAAIR